MPVRSSERSKVCRYTRGRTNTMRSGLRKCLRKADASAVAAPAHVVVALAAEFQVEGDLCEDGNTCVQLRFRQRDRRSSPTAGSTTILRSDFCTRSAEAVVNPVPVSGCAEPRPSLVKLGAEQEAVQLTVRPVGGVDEIVVTPAGAVGDALAGDAGLADVAVVVA